MIKKLKKKNGETLIEALVSLLIAILAMGLVNSATMAAANINKNTRDMGQTFADELQIAELHSTVEAGEKNLIIKVKDGENYATLKIDGTDFEEKVTIYSNGSRFASYEKKVDAE